MSTHDCSLTFCLSFHLHPTFLPTQTTTPKTNPMDELKQRWRERTESPNSVKRWLLKQENSAPTLPRQKLKSKRRDFLDEFFLDPKTKEWMLRVRGVPEQILFVDTVVDKVEQIWQKRGPVTGRTLPMKRMSPWYTGLN
jgi:hypothetical protein